MTPNREQEDRRRTCRVALNLSATAREAGRSKVPVRVVDISTLGCRVEALNWPFAGSCIWLSIAGLEAKQTRIVWRRDGFAGLEFDNPLSEPVLESILAAQHPQVETIVADLRDLASRSKQLAKRSADPNPDLLRLSKDCFVYALVHALKSTEKPAARFAPPQLTSSMIRRNVPDQQIEPGFSFHF